MSGEKERAEWKVKGGGGGEGGETGKGGEANAHQV